MVTLDSVVRVRYNGVDKNVPAVLVTPRDTSKPRRRFAVSDHTPDLPLKQCSKCGERYPATTEYFYFDKKKRDKLTCWCKVCSKAYNAANRDRKKAYNAKYHAANRDRAKVRDAEHYAKNRDRIRVRAGKYYATNRDRIKAHVAEYYAQNRDKAKARVAEWQAKNPDKVHAYHTKWLANNPEKRRISYHRYYARKRALVASFSAAEWQRCLEYFGHCCVYCGRPRGLWHTLAQDHYIPLSRGGTYTADNIVPACHGDGGCNNRKCDRDAHEWLVGEFGARKARQIERRIRDYFDHVATEVNHV